MSTIGDGGPTEKWGSKIGVILAVAGSAVGLGNFLRFPGQAAKYGGGAFMIPYFISFLIVGIPICWAEWTMGRYGGRFGFNSSPGIFSVVWRRKVSKYFGALGLLIPVIIYMYYVYLESWCLAYACNYAAAAMGISDSLGMGRALDLGKNPAAYQDFFTSLTGTDAHGKAFQSGHQQIILFFSITFLVNFYLVYRGITKGIEQFCKFAMPLLILAAIVVVGRVLTLPEQPIPDPWQHSLAKALPDDEWQKVRQAALSDKTTTGQMKAQLDKSLTKYFQQVRQRTAGYHSDVAVAPPVGFAASPAGLALAMAEMRADPVGGQYREWVRQTRQTLPADVKIDLQQLERRELLALDKVKKLTAKQEQLQEAAESASTHEHAKIDRAQSSLQSVLQDIRRRRSDLLGQCSPMPSLVAVLTKVATADTPDAVQAVAIQERGAALEVAALPRTVWNGLGYMWNPNFPDLLVPEVWIAAAGQIFFSLSIGFGIVLCYASYLRRDDDVVLSGLTASATNEFCEVVLGGLVAIPATFIFLGTATTLSVINSGSTFGLGFNALPAVFANMPAGLTFGAIWFGLLFLAGVTSSLSMLQPAIAFLEEGFGLRRRASVAALGLLTVSGALTVIYFSGNVVALDTMDFWVGSVAIYILATIQVLLFGWAMGIEQGLAEAHRGANMRIPAIFGFILKFITPAYLLIIFAVWIWNTLPDYARAILENTPALLVVINMIIVLLFLLLMISLAGEQWHKQGRGEKEVDQ